MTISASCNSCFKQYQLKDALAGRKVRCKACGEVFTVPQSGAPAETPDLWDDDAIDEDPYADEVAAPSRAKRQRSSTRKKKKRKSARNADSVISFGVIAGLTAVGGVLFLLTCVIGFFWPTAWVVMLYGLLLVGAGLSLVGGIGLIVVAFQEDVICGVMYLIVPFYALYYIISRFGEVWKLVLISLLGDVMLLLTIGLGQVIETGVAAADRDGIPGPRGFAGIMEERAAAQNQASRNNLNRLGLWMHNFHDEHRQLPPRAAEEGEFLISWQTSLLPYSDSRWIYNQIDRQAAWDDPVNQPPGGAVVQEFLQPAIDETKDARGYALSHYALNQVLVGDSGGPAIRDVHDGLSNTVMTGEVGGGYKPWADPSNVRNVSAGLSPGPATFGNPSGEGGFLGMVDGSVRWFGSDTDPQVLRAISTPSGGEPVEF